MSDESKPSFADRFFNAFFGIIDKPVTLFREKVVEPFHSGERPKYYHRRFRRVPTIDECEQEDPLCFFEAQEQYKRDKLVDGEILKILRERRIECEMYYGPADGPRECAKTVDDYETAATNFFIKYGDMGGYPNVKESYMKQKHRMIWERRHGPVGSGMAGQESH